MCERSTVRPEAFETICPGRVEMTKGKGGNALRSVVTRVVATSILLGVYSVGAVVVTGGVMATTM